MNILRLFMLVGALALTGCASVSTTPPKNPESLCAIFSEKPSWKRYAQDASKRWNTHVPSMMAIMYQESSFIHDARPMKKSFFGLVETPRSSAYGYSQALDGTWQNYLERTGRSRARRDRFEDSIDFMGWYLSVSQHRGIKITDTYSHYLAYHEGWGGFRSKTYQKKPWLMEVSKKVEARAKRYAQEYQSCRR